MSPTNALTKSPCRVYIVPETHWDRAWYLPFEQFRRKLVQFFDRLVEELTRSEDFTCFVADGQTVMVEDYLQIRPEMRPTLEGLVKAGRLKIGPWYVLPDEFIVAGESLVRNLAQGRRLAASLGGVMNVGYVPDPFGHVAQLPQILRGFGIDNFLFSRGVLNELNEAEFTWQAPDGSSVLALLQRDFYCNASYLGFPHFWGASDRMSFSMKEALGQIEKAVNSLAAHSQTHAYLLNNGVDHSEYQPDLPRIVAQARQRWPKAEIRIAGFDDYVRAVKHDLKGKRLPVKDHELTYPFTCLLKGVYSARVYLKQANQRCETLLCHFAEPLEAIATLAKPKRMNERALMDYAWRELLKCHPHDDICGCSVDSVHRDMMNRFDRVEQIGWAVASEALRDVANVMDHTGQAGVPMVLFNSSARQRRGAQRVLFLFDPKEEDLKQGRFRLVDGTAHEVPFEFVGAREMNFMEIRKLFQMAVAEVLVDAGALPPCGFTTLYVQPLAMRAKPAVPKARVRTTKREIENEYLKVRVAPDGAYTLTDKAAGMIYKGLGLLEDVEDCGDEYNWSDLEETELHTSAGVEAEVEVAGRGPLGGTLRIKQQLQIPAALTEDRKARSPEKVELPIVTELTLRAGSRRLEIKTIVDNRAMDHRLRVLFPTPYLSDKVQAGGHFDTVERPVDPTCQPQYVPNYNWPLCSTEHFGGFVRLGDKKSGLALLAKGLCEYEALLGKTGHALALTLFRSVGYLSRGDFKRRPAHAGPGDLATPEAQMLGTHTFEYALYPHEGDWTKAELAQEAQEFSQPVMCDRGDRHNTLVIAGHEGRTRPIPREGTLPETFSLISVEPGNLVLTALKKADEGKEWIARFYNQTPKDVKGAIEFAFPAKGVWLADLAEKKQSAQPLGRGKRIELSVPGKKIITLAIRF